MLLEVIMYEVGREERTEQSVPFLTVEVLRSLENGCRYVDDMGLLNGGFFTSKFKVETANKTATK